MKAYQYDSETKKYIGEIDRQLDPLESQAQGKEIYLMPADSTDIVPPESKDGYDIVFNGTDWEYKEIEKPEPQPQPTIEEQNEQIRQRRAYLYSSLIDPLHAEKQRKTVLGTWTEEMEAEYIAKVKELTEQIQTENPYETVD
ncbi:MAG: hypothetical protein ACLRFN_02430 [Alphaproteobacteria bacterium]